MDQTAEKLIQFYNEGRYLLCYFNYDASINNGSHMALYKKIITAHDNLFISIIETCKRLHSFNLWHNYACDVLISRYPNEPKWKYEKLFYLTQKERNKFPLYEKIYEKQIDKSDVYYRYVRLIYELCVLDYNGIHYQNSFKIAMDAANSGKVLYSIINLHVLTLPWNDTQYNQFYTKCSEFQMANIVTLPEIPKTITTKFPERRLRVGFYSNDFSNRPSGQLALKLLYYLKERVDIYLFCHQTFVQDAFFEFFISCAKFYYVTKIDESYEEIAKVIQKHEIDILIDMKGRMIGNQLDVFAYRPAPIQISWLAYPGSTGMKTMDYLIGDDTVLTEDITVECPEKLIYFPICYQINNDSQYKEQIAVNQSPPDVITFGSFNFLYKVDERTCDLYKRILREYPKSILMLLKTSEESDVRNNFGDLADRVVFCPYMAKPHHLWRLFAQVDIGLDTVYCNSHTTASDMLFAGVPIVTLKTNTYQGRVCADLLEAIDCPEYIATDDEQYLSIVRKLTQLNKKDFFDLKFKIRSKLFNSTLYNTYLYSEYFFDVLKVAYENHEKGIKENIKISKIDPMLHVELDVIRPGWRGNRFVVKFDKGDVGIIQMVIDGMKIAIVGMEKEIYVNEFKVLTHDYLKQDSVEMLFVVDEEKHKLVIANHLYILPQNITEGKISINKPFGVPDSKAKISIDVIVVEKPVIPQPTDTNLPLSESKVTDIPIAISS